MWCGALAALALVCASSFALAEESPPRRPFETLSPWTLERGQWEGAAGVLYRKDAAAPFFSDRRRARRDEWRLSLVDVALGLGSSGEARLQFGLQRFAEQGGLEESGIQDVRLSFTYRLPPRRIDTALQLEVKLPNASGERRLGTDETDLFLMGGAGHRAGRWGWAADLGLGILGSPSDAGVQDDVVVGGVSAWFTPSLAGPGSRWTLLGEVHAMAASRFGNDFRYARAGVRVGRRFPVDLSVRRGLTAASETWGAEAGITIRRPGRSRIP
jgi:hypothetical protein